MSITDGHRLVTTTETITTGSTTLNTTLTPTTTKATRNILVSILISVLTNMLLILPVSLPLSATPVNDNAVYFSAHEPSSVRGFDTKNQLAIDFSDIRVAPSGAISFVASSFNGSVKVAIDPAQQTPEEIAVALQMAENVFSDISSGAFGATANVVVDTPAQPDSAISSSSARPAPSGKSKTICVVSGSVAGATVIGSFYFLITRALSSRLGTFDAFLLADGVIIAGLITYFGCR